MSEERGEDILWNNPTYLGKPLPRDEILEEHKPITIEDVMAAEGVELTDWQRDYLEMYYAPRIEVNNPRHKDLKSDWVKGYSAPIIETQAQEVKLQKIPMDPGTRAALTFFLATLFCVTALIAWVIYMIFS